MGLIWTLIAVGLFLIAVEVFREYRLANPKDERLSSLPPLPRHRRRHTGKFAARRLAEPF